MDSFITVILLGLLALGHATPLILDEHHLNSLTTQVPSEETTSMNIMVANSTTAEEKVKAETEEGFTTEASATEKDQDSRLGRAPRHSDTSMSSTVEPPQSEAKSTAHPLNDMSDEGSGEETTTTTTQMTTTTSSIPITEKSLNEFLKMNGEGFGESDEEMTTTKATASPRVMILNEPGSGDFDTTTATSTDVTRAAFPLPSEGTVTNTMIKQEIINNLLGSDKDVAVSPMTLKDPPTQMPKGHQTPDWVIILGFLVGIAVLVLLCVAVATRDKWNRPNQFNSTIHNSASVQPAEQEKATELDTFLYNELPPKENGKAEEYTVIPLDELPDSYSS